jgi:predicted extracellular nuclease
MNNMKRTILAAWLILSLALGSSAQDQGIPDPAKRFRVAFYNVENLFDTVNDPKINDEDFLPGSRIAWTSARYETKLDRISEVAAGLSEGRPVAVMGLCEVENQSVLEDLVRSPRIVRFRFGIIHSDSPDERGIDNAMIYDPAQFLPIATRHIPVDLGAEDKTRDILYVKGIALKSAKDTLHIFVNHWPSRSEGREVSEPKRIVAAAALKKVTDSLLAGNRAPLIIILGDFNDEPSDKSLNAVLQALPPEGIAEERKLYNLMFPALQAGEGTLFWKDWDVFDQVIVSGALREKRKGLQAAGTRAGIFSPDYLFYSGSDGVKKPNRTAAREYYGGYSDHLPVFIDLEIKK